MARGNQRDKAREKNLKEQAGKAAAIRYRVRTHQGERSGDHAC
ncbi:hypothetical protein IG631_19498 [Alternaria alternata]|nr:hypothetical protein IG631_19498 [Alternaria alternata]